MSEEVQQIQQVEQTTTVEETKGDDGYPSEFIRDPILDTEEMKKIFVGGITPESKDEELKDFFEKVSGGKVIDHVIIRKDSEKKSCFGFVTLDTSDLVDEVLLKRAELIFNGRNLDVNRAVPKNNTWRGAHEKTKKLFIANLPKLNCTDADLMAYFKQRHPPKYGTIDSVRLIENDAKTENKGYGFIEVSSEDMADKMAIQHQTFDFKGRKIECKKSVPSGGEGGNSGGGGGRGGRGAKSGGRGGRGGRGGGGGGGYGGYYNYDPYGYGGDGYYGYDQQYYGGYYGGPPARGRGRGGQRYQPY